MRLAFLGTPQFAVPSLQALVRAGHDVAVVYSQPDRPKGRGQRVAWPPVKEAAVALNLPVRQPERVKRPEVVAELAELATEAMVVVGYGQIIPQSILNLPRLGIVNVHASLLPKYRGAAPVQWAVAHGERETGVTTMRIDAGLDTGDMLLKAVTPIGPGETALEVGERLSVMGADLLVETMQGLADGTIVPTPQDATQATYAPILKKEDGRIDWRQPAEAIHNRVRGLLPWPGCHSRFRGQGLQVWRTTLAAERDLGEPGTLAAAKRRLLAACGGGTVLELAEVQLEGRKRVSGEAFANGMRLEPADRLGEGEL